MANGHLSACKECCKARSKARLDRISKTPEFKEKEKTRSQDRYQRLYSNGRRKKYSPEVKRKYSQSYKNKYPEKKKAGMAICDFIKIPGHQYHHWSYNLEHHKDVISLPTKIHYTIHRQMQYDQASKMYRTVSGELLNTKEKHLGYINEIRMGG